jgi:hypothetical protein
LKGFFHQTGEYLFLIGVERIKATHSLTEPLPVTCVVVLFYDSIHAKQIFLRLHIRDRTKKIKVVSHGQYRKTTERRK